MRQQLTLGRWSEFAPHIAVGQAVGSSCLHVSREKPRRVFRHGFIEDDEKEANTRVGAAQFNQGRRLTRACHWRRVIFDAVRQPIRDGVLKLLGSPGLCSKESILQAYVVWRAGTTTLFLLGS